MNARFEQNARLIGVVGKKGSGTLDNGALWQTDRVELHCAVPFPSDDPMATGETVVVYAVADFEKHYEMAKSLVSNPIVLRMELVPSKKLGAAPKMECYGFYPDNTELKQKKLTPESVTVSSAAQK
jgi:hypothetical protein